MQLWRNDRWPILLIMVAVICGYFSALPRYLLLADDYGIAGMNVGQYQGSSIEQVGVWRCLGFAIISTGLHIEPTAFMALMVLVHALNAVLLFVLIRRMTGEPTVALPLALLFGVFPGPHEAIVWAAATGYIASTFVFLAATLVLTGGPGTGAGARNQAVAFTLVAALVLIQNLIWEQLVFSSMAIGVVAMGMQGRAPLKDLVRLSFRRFSVWAPIVGAATFIVLFKLTEKSTSIKKTGFNPRSVLSAYFYQYTNLNAFSPWLSRTTRAFMFFEWTPLMVVFAGVSAAVVLWLSVGLARSLRRESTTKDSNWLLPVGIVLMCLGASAVFVFAGGFSVDSRKKYSFVLLILLAAGWVWSRFPRLVPLRGGTVAAAALGICLLCVPTLWQLNGIWRYEVKRFDALNRFFESEPTVTEVRVDCADSVTRAWPRAARFWGTWPFVESEIGWIVELTLQMRHSSPVKVTDSPAAPLVRYDEVSQVWRFDPPRSNHDAD